MTSDTDTGDMAHKARGAQQLVPLAAPLRRGLSGVSRRLLSLHRRKYVKIYSLGCIRADEADGGAGMAFTSPSLLRSKGSRGAHFCPVIEGFHCQVIPAAFICMMACMLSNEASTTHQKEFLGRRHGGCCLTSGHPLIRVMCPAELRSFSESPFMLEASHLKRTPVLRIYRGRNGFNHRPSG
jgi:hypothetical protein